MERKRAKKGGADADAGCVCVSDARVKSRVRGGEQEVRVFKPDSLPVSRFDRSYVLDQRLIESLRATRAPREERVTGSPSAPASPAAAGEAGG